MDLDQVVEKIQNRARDQRSLALRDYSDFYKINTDFQDEYNEASKILFGFDDDQYSPPIWTTGFADLLKEYAQEAQIIWNGPIQKENEEEEYIKCINQKGLLSNIFTDIYNKEIEPFYSTISINNCNLYILDTCFDINGKLWILIKIEEDSISPIFENIYFINIDRTFLFGEWERCYINTNAFCPIDSEHLYIFDEDYDCKIKNYRNLSEEYTIDGFYNGSCFYYHEKKEELYFTISNSGYETIAKFSISESDEEIEIIDEILDEGIVKINQIYVNRLDNMIYFLTNPTPSTTKFYKARGVRIKARQEFQYKVNNFYLDSNNNIIFPYITQEKINDINTYIFNIISTPVLYMGKSDNFIQYSQLTKEELFPISEGTITIDDYNFIPSYFNSEELSIAIGKFYSNIESNLIKEIRFFEFSPYIDPQIDLDEKILDSVHNGFFLSYYYYGGGVGYNFSRGETVDFNIDNPISLSYNNIKYDNNFIVSSIKCKVNNTESIYIIFFEPIGTEYRLKILKLYWNDSHNKWMSDTSYIINSSYNISDVSKFYGIESCIDENYNTLLVTFSYEKSGGSEIIGYYAIDPSPVSGSELLVKEDYFRGVYLIPQCSCSYDNINNIFGLTFLEQDSGGTNQRITLILIDINGEIITPNYTIQTSSDLTTNKVLIIFNEEEELFYIFFNRYISVGGIDLFIRTYKHTGSIGSLKRLTFNPRDGISSNHYKMSGCYNKEEGEIALLYPHSRNNSDYYNFYYFRIKNNSIISSKLMENLEYINKKVYNVGIAYNYYEDKLAIFYISNKESDTTNFLYLSIMDYNGQFFLKDYIVLDTIIDDIAYGIDTTMSIINTDDVKFPAKPEIPKPKLDIYIQNFFKENKNMQKMKLYFKEEFYDKFKQQQNDPYYYPNNTPHIKVNTTEWEHDKKSSLQKILYLENEEVNEENIINLCYKIINETNDDNRVYYSNKIKALFYGEYTNSNSPSVIYKSKYPYSYHSLIHKIYQQNIYFMDGRNELLNKFNNMLNDINDKVIISKGEESPYTSPSFGSPMDYLYAFNSNNIDLSNYNFIDKAGSDYSISTNYEFEIESWINSLPEDSADWSSTYTDIVYKIAFAFIMRWIYIVYEVFNGKDYYSLGENYFTLSEISSEIENNNSENKWSNAWEVWSAYLANKSGGLMGSVLSIEKNFKHLSEAIDREEKKLKNILGETSESYWIETPTMSGCNGTLIPNPLDNSTLFGSVTIRWFQINYATKYEIFRRDKSDFVEPLTNEDNNEWEDKYKIKELTTDDIKEGEGFIRPFYTDNTVKKGKDYIYRVRAIASPSSPKDPYYYSDYETKSKQSDIIDTTEAGRIIFNDKAIAKIKQPRFKRGL